MKVGDVCVKTAGREAGKEVVVVDIIDDTFVLIDGPGVKRRRCNVRHLVPTGKKVNIKKGASHEEVLKALEALK